MKIEKLRPIPKYIVERIKKKDRELHPAQDGLTRFYSYLAKNDGDLIKVAVAVKCRYKNWYCKQVSVHGVHSDRAYVKDMIFNYIAGTIVGWYSEGLTKAPKWYEDGEWGWNDDKYFNPHAPIVNLEFLAKFPQYKYAAWELYKGAEIIQYLRTYEQYPQLEYLMKLGLSDFIKSTQILEKMGKDKKFCKWLAQNRKELAARYYYVAVVLQAYKKGCDLAELQIYTETKKNLPKHRRRKEILELFDGDAEFFYRYVAKHKAGLAIYLDYLDACNYLGLDMSLPKNYKPIEFQRWHDIRTDEYRTAKAIADEKERAELYAKFAVVAEKYLPLQRAQDDVYIALIAKSPAELINEGETLGHCVGRMGYDQKFVREETLIFFIRSVKQPDVPLITIEYSLSAHKILQSYGSNHKKPTPEIHDYIHKKWLPHANRKLQAIAA